MKIGINSIALNGFRIPVPNGLSDVLNEGNGWDVKEIESQEYQRETVQHDGKLITYLKKR